MSHEYTPTMNVFSKQYTFFPLFLGQLNDIYKDYKYTYIGCGIILVIASMFLFIGMGINYHLLDRERKAEVEKAGPEIYDEETNIDNAMKEKEKEAENVSTPLTHASVANMDEDVV